MLEVAGGIVLAYLVLVFAVPVVLGAFFGIASLMQAKPAPVTTKKWEYSDSEYYEMFPDCRPTADSRTSQRTQSDS